MAYKLNEPTERAKRLSKMKRMGLSMAQAIRKKRTETKDTPMTMPGGSLRENRAAMNVPPKMAADMKKKFPGIFK